MGPLFRGASAFKNPRRAAGNYLSRAPHRTESVDLSYEELGKLLLRFRKSRYFRPFYLAVLGIVVLGLYWFTAGSQVTFCLGVLLIPAAALVIPYWLGERSLKNFAVNALPIFVIGLLLVAAFQTGALLSQGPPVLTSGNDPATANADLPHFSFWNGTVEPDRGGAGQNFPFLGGPKVVTATGAVVPPQANLTVTANLSQSSDGISGTPITLTMHVDPSRGNTSNGTWYAAQRALPASVYLFWFWANDTNMSNSVASNYVLSPLNAPWGTYYYFWTVYTVFNFIFPVSFYFIIVFMYWYTVRMRKMRERMMDKARGEKLDFEKDKSKKEGTGEKEDEAKTAATAPASEKTKKAAAFTCTNCGADVSEDDTKCPKCGAVFED